VTSAARSRGSPAAWTGIAVAPASWYAMHLAIGMLSPWQCAGWPFLTPSIAALAALLTAAGGVLSWRSLQDPAVAVEHRRHFVARLGMAASLLFLFVIACQAAAGLVYSGCER
jgi:hypothetical protein